MVDNVIANQEGGKQTVIVIGKIQGQLGPDISICRHGF